MFLVLDKSWSCNVFSFLLVLVSVFLWSRLGPGLDSPGLVFVLVLVLIPLVLVLVLVLINLVLVWVSVKVILTTSLV